MILFKANEEYFSEMTKIKAVSPLGITENSNNSPETTQKILELINQKLKNQGFNLQSNVKYYLAELTCSLPGNWN